MGRWDDWWDKSRVDQYYEPTGAWRIGVSKIWKCGVVAARDLERGEYLGVGVVRDPVSFQWSRITPWLGRAVNHCDSPNTVPKKDRNVVRAFARRKIAAGTELTADYNDDSRLFPGIAPARADWTC